MATTGSIFPRKNSYNNTPAKREEKVAPVQFFIDISSYLKIRTRQIYFFGYAAFLIISGALSDIKAWSVRRMFWGRSSLYRSAFHTIVSIITIIAVLSGVTSRLNVATSASETGSLDLASGILGRQDIFSQSGTVESLGALQETDTDYPVYKYVVQRDDTLSKIAKEYQINESTIKWANKLTSDTLKVGQVLTIPGIDGAFITVKDGDTLESIAKKHEGNVLDIIDLNSHIIDRRDPKVKVGMELFIPNGVIPAPPPVVRTYTRAPSTPIVGDPGGIDVPPGTFVHPLGTACPGWSWSRGFASYHGGVDMAKAGGCWENSVGSGTVTYAGWGAAGQGYYVTIDHGGGISTNYYHGTGSFAVRTGDQVLAGQKIMYMGCTGYCTGTHLHFEFRINGVKVNPESYIKLR